MSVWLRHALVAGAMTLALAGMIADKQFTLATGRTVVLKVAPVDPRSLFRGDYVRLGYEISRLNVGALPGDDTFARHGTAWVVLAPGTPYWQAVSAHRERPREVPPQHVALRGRVRWSAVAGTAAGPHLRVRYGIEQLYVPEGEGRAIEDDVREREAAVRVAVDRFGRAGILALLLDGEPVHEERLF